MATATAAHPPGPPELLPGRPDAIVDLQTDEGVALVGGQWRYSDARAEEVDFVALAGPGTEDPLGPGTEPIRTYEVTPRAEAADHDDSDWQALAPADTMRRLANGRVCFNWYRIAVTLPERVGDTDVTGTTVVFEVVVDDYAEVWVNGALPHALGDTGGPVAGGFNAPNRVMLSSDARPGERFTIAVFGINGPISAAPANYIWMRTATLDLYAGERASAAESAALDVERADPRLDSIVPAGVRLSAWPAASSSSRGRSGRPRARCCSAPRIPTRSTDSIRRSAGSRSSARRAATRAPTSAASRSRVRTGSPSTRKGGW